MRWELMSLTRARREKNELNQTLVVSCLWLFMWRWEKYNEKIIFLNIFFCSVEDDRVEHGLLKWKIKGKFLFAQSCSCSRQLLISKKTRQMILLIINASTSSMLLRRNLKFNDRFHLVLRSSSWNLSKLKFIFTYSILNISSHFESRTTTSFPLPHTLPFCWTATTTIIWRNYSVSFLTKNFEFICAISNDPLRKRKLFTRIKCVSHL